MKHKIPQKIFVLLFLIFVLNGCKQGGCGIWNPCPSVNVGFLYLNDSTAKWLPWSIDSIYLKNSNGFATILSATKVDPTQPKEVSFREEDGPNAECYLGYCRDYVTCERQGWTFSGQEINLIYEITRSPQPSAYDLRHKPQPGEIKSLGDHLLIKIGGAYFVTDFSKEIFHSVYTINGITFDSVYEVRQGFANSGIVVPEKIFLKKGKGLIGYILANGEQWSLEIK